MRRPIHVHPQIGPDVPPGLMPDLWGFGASGEAARRTRSAGRPRSQELRGPAAALAELIESIGRLFA